MLKLLWDGEQRVAVRQGKGVSVSVPQTSEPGGRNTTVVATAGHPCPSEYTSLKSNMLYIHIPMNAMRRFDECKNFSLVTSI